jgi:hypothetical protein
MADPRFGGDDDLPRTLRRAREERDREIREREVHGHPQSWAGTPDELAPPYDMRGSTSASLEMPRGPVAVGRLQIPFIHLVWFFLKAVLAAIPALVLLTLLLFAGGQVLKTFFPGLRHFEIIIRSAEAPPVAPAPVEAARPAPAKK